MEDEDAKRADRLGAIRQEMRFEIGLLHERVNALLAAEAFLTIAYTAAMGSSGRWGAVVAPVLSVLGLLLAALVWPGVTTTARLVMTWTMQTGDLLDQSAEQRPVWADAHRSRRAREAGQRRSLLFFRAAPAVFVVVWILFLVLSLTARA